MRRRHIENHSAHRVGWLRAAVLGANDGLVSTASLIVGVAAASASNNEILIAGIAGLVAGAMSMAAGEYVSVSSQLDSESADLEKEKRELIEQPELEIQELQYIFIHRGLKEETALEVAKQLTAHDALSAHAREELGISEITTARPLQAAITSAITFAIGAGLPLVSVLFLPTQFVTYGVVISTLVFLALLGSMGAKVGGADMAKAMARVTLWGCVAMAITALIGYVFGVTV